jgi:hypothetical protein
MLFRRLIILSVMLLAGLTACRKTTPTPCAAGLASATVVHGRNLCDQNGYVIRLDGGATYPPDALPADFQQDGLKVCLSYSVYEDLRLCACCGGPRMQIQQIQRQ